MSVKRTFPSLVPVAAGVYFLHESNKFCHTPVGSFFFCAHNVFSADRGHHQAFLNAPDDLAAVKTELGIQF